VRESDVQTYTRGERYLSKHTGIAQVLKRRKRTIEAGPSAEVFDVLLNKYTR